MRALHAVVAVASVLTLSPLSGCSGRPAPAGDAAAPPDAGQVPVGDPRGWKCEPVDGGLRCERVGAARGLPADVGTWECHLRSRSLAPDGSWDCGGPPRYWLCYGRTPGPAAPSDLGVSDRWRCSPAGTLDGAAITRCEKDLSLDDLPPGSVVRPACKCTKDVACADCAKGSAVGGTVCWVGRPAPGPPPPSPTLHDSCVPGTRRWCDGLRYGPWGIATCRADGSWPTRVVNGKVIFDCTETPQMRRPDTLCACYHYYFNPACCERPDCVLPPGTNGRVCQPSAGQPCDYCNPQKPECVGAGARCVVTNAAETFCAAACKDDGDCPVDHSCVDVKGGSNCVPNDFGCYW